MTLVYLHPNNAEFVCKNTLHSTDIMAFAEIVRGELHAENTVQLIMEPGDATRYEFLIYPMTGKQEYIVSCVIGNNWSCKVHNGHIPYEPHHFEVEANPCTLKLIADLMNLVVGQGLQGYYDFKLGRAIQ